MERDSARKARKFNVEAKYGVSLETIKNMEWVQGGRCAICKTKPKELLHIDHDHETGRVRGLLCRSCNQGLGMFGDNIEYLLNAVGYLTAYREEMYRLVEQEYNE